MLAALAKPRPMAVPSSRPKAVARSTWSSERLTILWSSVSGLWAKDSLEKMTRPMRSYGRSAIKSLMTCLAACKRLSGWKSSEAILPEMSRARAMSTPSPLMVSRPCTIWGRARAKTTRAMAIRRNPVVMGRQTTRQERGKSRMRLAGAYCMAAGWDCRRFKKRQAVSNPTSNSKPSIQGEAN